MLKRKKNHKTGLVGVCPSSGPPWAEAQQGTRKPQNQRAHGRLCGEPGQLCLNPLEGWARVPAPSHTGAHSPCNASLPSVQPTLFTGQALLWDESAGAQHLQITELGREPLCEPYPCRTASPVGSTEPQA